MYTTMTWEEFETTYKPIQNKLTKYPSDNNISFETYGEEQEFVLAQDEKFVWTEVDGDGGCYIINGLHYVNRIQYYVCEVPNALPTYKVSVSVEVPLGEDVSVDDVADNVSISVDYFGTGELLESDTDLDDWNERS